MLSFLLMSVGLLAQKTGAITYTQVIKLDIQGIEGLDLAGILPTDMSSSKTLYFDEGSSIYKDAEDHVDEDVEISSDDGSFEMVFSTGGEGEEILYTNLREKRVLQQTSFMGKEFLIESSLDKPKWKITKERIKYLGYVCQKATRTDIVPPTPGSSEAAKEREVVAWFTSEIPTSIGPGDYNQLPGAVLLVSVDEGMTEIKATAVELDVPISEKMVLPSKGQKVSPEEYEVIMTEKMKELEEMYNNTEGRSIMIRG